MRPTMKFAEYSHLVVVLHMRIIFQRKEKQKRETNLKVKLKENFKFFLTLGKLERSFAYVLVCFEPNECIFMLVKSHVFHDSIYKENTKIFMINRSTHDFQKIVTVDI